MNRLFTSRGERSLGWVLVLSGALLLQLGGLAAVAGAAEELAGTWRALMKTPQEDIEIVLSLDLTEGEWSGTISDPMGSGFATSLADDVTLIGRGTDVWSGTPAEIRADRALKSRWLGV